MVITCPSLTWAGHRAMGWLSAAVSAHAITCGVEVVQLALGGCAACQGMQLLLTHLIAASGLSSTSTSQAYGVG